MYVQECVDIAAQYGKGLMYSTLSRQEPQEKDRKEHRDFWPDSTG